MVMIAWIAIPILATGMAIAAALDVFSDRRQEWRRFVHAVLAGVLMWVAAMNFLMDLFQKMLTS